MRKSYFPLITAVLLMSACAPAVLPATITTPAPADVSVRITNDSAGFQRVLITAGATELFVKTLTLSGVQVAVNDDKCKANGSSAVCTIGRIPAKATYNLPARGVLQAQLEANVAGGDTFFITVTPP